jgi:hypothetical protein
MRYRAERQYSAFLVARLFEVLGTCRGFEQGVPRVVLRKYCNAGVTGTRVRIKQKSPIKIGKESCELLERKDLTHRTRSLRAQRTGKTAGN